MATSSVIVYETTPRWTPELQRQFDGEDVRVRACGTIQGLTQRIAEQNSLTDVTPGGVIILDLGTHPADCLQFLGATSDLYDDWSKVVISSEQLSELEWSTRELGAIGFFSEFASGHELSRLCRRQLTSRAKY